MGMNSAVSFLKSRESRGCLRGSPASKWKGTNHAVSESVS